MRSRADLFPHQVKAVARMVEARQLACFMAPGEGKSITTLTALNDLGRPRTLVLAPALVADTVWHAEASRWEHLRDMRVARATGDEMQRIGVLTDLRNDVVTLSYENFPWLLSSMRAKGCSTIPEWFGAIVFDELSRMKNVDTVKFRRFRTPVRRMPIRFGLTGTPVGNHLLDIWAELYMIADEKPLGPSKGQFVAKYFAPGAVVNGRVVGWSPHPYAQREIEARVKPYAFTLPPTVSASCELRVNCIDVPLPARVEEQMDDFVAQLQVTLDSGADLFAFSATTAAMKARQMVGGAVYLDPPTELGEPPPKGPKKWEVLHAAKLTALETLVGELQGEPLIVFYWFKHEAERILAHFTGRARMLDGAQAITDWNARKVEILLAHPASAGHGINLQHGGHNICWYTLPYSLEMWMQANGRLVRTGQKSDHVFAHVLEAGRSDKRVLAALRRKDAVQDQLLRAMLA